MLYQNHHPGRGNGVLAPAPGSENWQNGPFTVVPILPTWSATIEPSGALLRCSDGVTIVPV